MNQIYSQMWMSLDKHIRTILAKQFNLARTGPVEVIDSHVVTDGHTNEDLKAITIEAMREYVGKEGSLMGLWELTVLKAQGIEEKVEEVAPVVETVVVEQPIIEEKKPLCDSCDTKGYIHKKECPHYKPREIKYND